MLKISPIIILSLFVIACSTKEDSKNQYLRINGQAQGTTYSIVLDSSGVGMIEKVEIDSIFDRIDSSLSVWKPGSVINHFNSSDSLIIDDSHFINVYYRSIEIGEMSNGSFNFQIGPLVNAWGFGKNNEKPTASIDPDSLIPLVQNPIKAEIDSSVSSILFIKDPKQSIDVNGIAQGYTVDVIFQYLIDRGAGNALVEVGGEVRTIGVNEEGNAWTIGIDKPVSELENRELEAVVPVDNRSLATSGSYRKFYEIDGNKYSHTIDPSTGFPVDHNLLSVTVLASNCTNADAFATAFMVMGKDQTLEFIKDHPELKIEAFLIFSDKTGNLITERTAGFEIIEP